MPYPLEIPEPLRKESIVSLKRYFEQNFTEQIGDLAAANLLQFFLEEIGPVIYNKAVADVQQRLQTRIMDLDSEVYMDPFQYWTRLERGKKLKLSGPGRIR